MSKLHIAFQEGFVNDSAVVYVNGAEAFRKTDLTTRLQIGRAHAVDLEVEDSPLNVEITFPVRHLSKSIRIDPSKPAYLGVSITLQGELALIKSDQPFGYL